MTAWLDKPLLSWSEAEKIAPARLSRRKLKRYAREGLLETYRLPPLPGAKVSEEFVRSASLAKLLGVTTEPLSKAYDHRQDFISHAVRSAARSLAVAMPRRTPGKRSPRR